MIKKEHKGTEIYVKVLDRNVLVSEENEELLKTVAPHVIEEVKAQVEEKADDNHKPGRK
jgi:hypothetical protein